MEKIFKFLTRNKEAWLITALVVIVLAVHGFNMFNYPYFENDEGIYVSRAWALLNEGRLDLYTYWYDHAPAGWMMMAGWGFITGGFDTFGMTVNSGRVFMLVLHAASALLVYYITKRLSGNIWVAAGAVLLFSLSPVAIYFQRRVLLDNIMTFWVLGAMALLLQKKTSLNTIVLSGLTFGIAMLTKESAVVFGPAIAYAVYKGADKQNLRFAVVLWTLIALSVVSWFFVFAMIKGEFLPGSDGSHVSVINTYRFHLARGEGEAFWSPDSDFMSNLRDWIKRDAMIIYLAIGSTTAGVLLSIRKPRFRMLALAAVFNWLFLMRGGLVINFYILPLIPIVAMLSGLTIQSALNFLVPTRQLRLGLVAAIILSLAAVMQIHGENLHWKADETTPQLEALNWVKEHAAAEDILVIDDTLLVDLRYPGNRDDARAGALSAWKVESDPAVKDDILFRDWRNIDYLVLSHEMVKQSGEGQFHLIPQALANAKPVATWKPSDKTYLDLDKLISTNGDWMEIYKINGREEVALDQLAGKFEQRYRYSYGQVIEPATGYTTSESQAAAMWLALIDEDQQKFADYWGWTKAHLQWRREDKLFMWLWKGNAAQDPATSAAADQDIAMALLLAADKWQVQEYRDEAKEIIEDIWEKEVGEVSGRYYLTAGAGGAKLYYNGYLVSPADLSPAYYRQFALIDPAHPWEALANQAYQTWDEIARWEENKTGLPPRWLLVDAETGTFQSARLVRGEEADWTGADSWRTARQAALDWQWYKMEPARLYLQSMSDNIQEAAIEKGRLARNYDLSGNEIHGESSRVGAIFAAIAHQQVDEGLSRQVYSKYLAADLIRSDADWRGVTDPAEYGWLTIDTALYQGIFPSLR